MRGLVAQPVRPGHELGGRQGAVRVGVGSLEDQLREGRYLARCDDTVTVRVDPPCDLFAQGARAVGLDLGGGGGRREAEQGQ